ncbi:MAG: hypothetical protein ACFFCW_21320 [Candidatus Hodarchaeota archaeon]
MNRFRWENVDWQRQTGKQATSSAAESPGGVSLFLGMVIQAEVNTIDPFIRVESWEAAE